MPQLDTIYIMLIYLWTWSVLYMVIKKTKMLLIKSTPKKEQTKMITPTNALPW
uniref:ATPase subunit 8 n=1 Tax=Sibynophis chinensis TaxID=1081078 RepID=T2DJC6_9SAUR|nr:ATP synthase F0 subunit 8 [Sibynophis chinensis]AGV52149.1 ATPase subunit 8 [Sibynophis chinensis]